MERITLQATLSRSGNAFSLWEFSVYGESASGDEEYLGQITGTDAFTKKPAQIVVWVGGSFDQNGKWLPDSQSYLTLQVQRSPNSPFNFTTM